MAADRTRSAVRHGRLEARPMETPDADTCAHLWLAGYRRAVSGDGTSVLPTVWLREPSRVRDFIAKRAETGYTLLAGTDIVGYLVSDRMRFHGRSAAFCPVLSHAVSPEYQAWGYRSLYRAASAQWVGDGALDHYISILAEDTAALGLFFDLGFGRYVIDAYRGVDVPGSAPPLDSGIHRVGSEAFHSVRFLMDMALEFYREPPLFLVQPPDSDDDLRGYLADDDIAVFVAHIGETPVGLMNARVSDNSDPVSLADPETALLDPLGAYIRPEYRNRGIGDSLLSQCVAWCRNRGAQRIHVDFEAANLFASAYWVKHFVPAIMSLKRSVHPDVLSYRRSP